MPALAFLNGRFIPESDLRLSPGDIGFQWGATVTERLRTFDGRPFRLADHLARFRRSAELCRVPLLDADLASIALELLHQNGASIDSELVLILFATPGVAGCPTLAMHTLPFEGTVYRRLIRQGATLMVPAIRHVPDSCVPRAAKMRSRMFWWMAEQEVKSIDPDAMALLLDLDDTVTETASANIVIVNEGTVFSPPRARALPGISLEVLRELCENRSIPFVEQPFRLDEFRKADEAILTSTPYSLCGVSRLDGDALPWPGPILQRLHDAWCQLVGQPIWAGME